MLEQATAEILRGARASASGSTAKGSCTTASRSASASAAHRIDFAPFAASVTVYGQTEITKDLMDARDALDGMLIYEADDVAIEGVAGAHAARQLAQGRRARTRSIATSSRAATASTA